MNEQEIQSIREQVFGQPSTHTSPPQNEVPAEQVVEKIETPTSIGKVEIQATLLASAPIDDKIVFLKENLGFESIEQAKAAIEDYNKLKSIPPPEPIKYHNDESKIVHELLLAGKIKEVKEIYDLQDTLDSVLSLDVTDNTAESILKTGMQFKYKELTPDQINHKFNKQYGIPKEPQAEKFITTEEYNEAKQEWDQEVESIKMDRIIDAQLVKPELAKSKTEIVLPKIPKDDSFLAYEKSLAETNSLNYFLASEKVEFSKLTPKDLNYSFKFNDEANKLAFDINFEPDTETFGKAVINASDMQNFLSTYYNEDGSPQRQEMLKAIYAGQNIDKIVTEAVIQATNETKKWFLRNQKNIPEAIHRNFTQIQPNEIEKLREQVFGKTG